MTELLQHLKTMIAAAGLSGHEAPIRAIIEEAWKPLTDELSVSRLGSLHALKRGVGKAPRPSVLVATHMDAIGMMVTKVQDGYLYLDEIGGIDPRVLPGQLVTVHGREDLPGVVVQPPAHALPEQYATNPVPLAHLMVDAGLTARQVEKLVRPGDLVSFASEPIEFDGNHLAGHSLDNRASVAALTEALRILQNRKHSWDVWAVATVQEEETLGGALTSGYQLRPDVAVVIDVTHAKSPGAPGHLTYAMDKGPTLDWGPNTHPKMYQSFKDLAKKLEIPWQESIYSRSSGTDAILLQVAGEGIPTGILSIPLRYMHTPVEMLQVRDIERTARLLAEFIAALDDKFMETLKLDEEKESES